MKKTKLTALATAALVTAAAALTSLPANAQQLPNADFEGEWAACKPWTSSNNTKEKGTNPDKWCISNVIGINGTGATQVGEKTEGYNSLSAAKIYNSPNSTLKSQTVPGYITLGTTWSTSVMGSNNDGGTWGGIKFNYKPDAISFQYQRTHGKGSTSSTTNTNEAATVVAYLWSGTYKQDKVPGNILIAGSPTTVTMENRDRNILGISTDKGGDITQEGKLIASINKKISGDAENWTYYEQAFDYLSDETPEMFNVILAANDYFAGSSNIGQGNTLIVDDVKLIYYSRLSDITIDGSSIPGFAEDKYEYEIEMPYSEDIKYTLKGQSATAEPIVYNETDKTATITVTNVDADSDGKSSHTYTITFNEPEIPEAEEGSAIFSGTLAIGLDSDPEPIDGTYYVTLKVTDIDKSAGIDKYDFMLKNFDMGMGNMGDIIVNEVEAKNLDDKLGSHYTGSNDNIILDIEGKTIGPIYAGAEIDAEEDEDGNLTATINVKWYTNRGQEAAAASTLALAEDDDTEEEHVPINVVFAGKKIDEKRPADRTGIEEIAADGAEGEAVYYNLQGVQVANPTGGIYIVRRAGKVSKEYVR